MARRVGRVAQVWRYPVKSMQGESLSSCLVGPRGIPGDRGWALRDDPGILKTVVSEARGDLGVYARVARPGTVRVGDPVELLA